MQIHQAVLRGDTEAVLRQLSLGTPVDCVDEESWGRTSLMLAAGSEHADLSLLKLLVARGANVNAIGLERGETSFSCASSNVEKMRYLLSVGANPFLGSSSSKKLGSTGSIEAIRFQLELGFDPTVREENASPVVFAGQACDRLQLELFKEFGFSLDSLGWNALMHEIIFGSSQKVEQLLNAGADDNSVDVWCRSPFLLSICSGDVQKAKLLLNSGYSLKEQGRYGESVIDCAILSQSGEMLSWLLSLGVDVNMRGLSDNTPLMAAAECKNSEAIKTLLERGAIVDEANEFGSQAINKVEDPDSIKLLAAAGANINHIDGTGSFPLIAAVESGNIELVKCLLDLGVKVDNRSSGMAALHQATNYDELQIMQLLLAAGADPNLEGEDEWCPLWYVRSREAAQILINAGASLLRIDCFGVTAADKCNDLDIKELLIAARNREIAANETEHPY